MIQCKPAATLLVECETKQLSDLYNHTDVLNVSGRNYGVLPGRDSASGSKTLQQDTGSPGSQTIQEEEITVIILYNTIQYTLFSRLGELVLDPQ